MHVEINYMKLSVGTLLTGVPQGSIGVASFRDLDEWFLELSNNPACLLTTQVYQVLMKTYCQSIHQMSTSALIMVLP